jgi:hypothetical protein
LRLNSRRRGERAQAASDEGSAIHLSRG